ncbi:MAG: M48 family metallopeptidase [Pseudoflavonifractor sp.]|nr:M48 family metallopeptidase [Alloprevotella sp.]MCM1116963.1 M48 family metallopeptidase [Pseudoflavonifractor sp.]
MRRIRMLAGALGALLMLFVAPSEADAQLNLSRLFQGVVKGVQAVTLSDAQVVAYIQEYVHYSDSVNQVLPATDPYSQRLSSITHGITNVDGMPLNFKVYRNEEVNAFACADGSVRVYTGLLDLMTDEEVLGVIGHEIGHVAHHDSRNQFKQALMNEAIADGLASTSSKVAALTDSQLGAIGNSLVSSKYSRKAETNADDYGYNFLKRNGRDPRAMVYAFRKLQAMEQQADAQSTPLSQLFSSHPDVGARISNMVKKCRKDGYPIN